MKQGVLFILLFTLTAGLFSCDDKPIPKDDLIIEPTNKGSVWIINEGNFQFGNATLTVLDFDKNQLFENVFETSNGRKLGDVFQSATVINKKAYLVVNNSQKIEVCNQSSLKAEATITGFTSPRYIIEATSGKAYVTEYYANAIRIVDLQSNQIIGSIAINGWGEEMVAINQKVFVTNPRNNQVIVIDAFTNNIIDSIPVGIAPSSIVADTAKNVWVLCKGNNSTPATLHSIDVSGLKILKTVVLPRTQTEATRLRIYAPNNKLYWLSKHVFSASATDSITTPTETINGVGFNFYGLGINPKNGELYVSDAKDFVQNSNILRYTNSGAFKAEFKAGIISGDFYFYFPK